jgi:hypothetical protein
VLLHKQKQLQWVHEVTPVHLADLVLKVHAVQLVQEVLRAQTVLKDDQEVPVLLVLKVSLVLTVKLVHKVLKVKPVPKAKMDKMEIKVLTVPQVLPNLLVSPLPSTVKMLKLQTVQLALSNSGMVTHCCTRLVTTITMLKI